MKSTDNIILNLETAEAFPLKSKQDQEALTLLLLALFWDKSMLKKEETQSQRSQKKEV